MKAVPLIKRRNIKLHKAGKTLAGTRSGAASVRGRMDDMHILTQTRTGRGIPFMQVIWSKKERREPLLLPDFSAHHLRHTFCTRLCENETNLKVIQSIMGHKDIQTTMDIYADCSDEKKKEVLNNMEDKVFVI